MITKLIVALALLISPLVCSAQLTLEECYRLSEQNYPLIKQYELIEASRDFQHKNLSTRYIPQIGLHARASYQSEVVALPNEFTDLASLAGIQFPSIPLDQYRVALEVSQLIWDGGATKSQKESVDLAKASLSAQTDVEIYTLRQRVNSLFFGVLLMDRQIQQLDIYIEELGRNHSRVSSLIENGVAYHSDLDLIEVEQISSKQNINTLYYNRSAYLMMLSAMIGTNLSESITLQSPPMVEPNSSNIQRAELDMFAAQSLQAQSLRASIKAKNMPTLSAFFNGAFSQPGLNMFDPSFGPNFIAGVNLSWNFGNLYTRKRELGLVDIDVRQIELQKEKFLYNLNLETIQQQNEIRSLEQRVEDDQRIVELRERIVQTAQSKVTNGTMSVYDLMKETSLKQSAQQNKLINQTQLLKAIYDLKYSLNN